MSTPHTKATIHRDGSVTIEGVGFTGPSCEQHTKPFRDALGGTGSSERKPEFYQQDSAGQQERAKQ